MPVHEKLAWINNVGDAGIDQDAFERSLAEAAEMLSFVPLKEADLPRGFPTHTPVGFIEIKSFPTYRLARGTGFFPLFMHIQRNGIAMTAPVEMEYSVDDKGKTRQANMAFLYGNTEIGDLGKKGNIEVMDVPPLTVVSLGVRGPTTDEAIEDGNRRLRAWIRDNPSYRKAGEMRMMGYNSPGVANQRRFFELQIPIEKAAD